MPTDKSRITAIPDTVALAVLGYEVSDGQTVCVNAPARRLADLVRRAAEEINMDRNEWNAIADVMNGCADLYDYSEISFSPIGMIRANLYDSQGIEAKWGISLKKLIKKLDAMQPVHGEAILCAVRWAWRHCETWDHTTDEWWKPEYRTKER